MKKLVILLIAWLFATTYIDAGVVFEQSFDLTAPPAGWSIQGYKGTDHLSAGTPILTANFFKNDGLPQPNYLRLTENSGWNRGWAYHNARSFPMLGKWKITAELRIGKDHTDPNQTGDGDGLAFVFADASTVTTAGIFDPTKVEGGYGEFLGTPRGDNQDTKKGYHAGFKGFSLEFDHYLNGSEMSKEYIHWVDLGQWIHSGYGKDVAPDANFYYNNNWKRVQIEGNNGTITLSYNWNGAVYNDSYSFNATTSTYGNPLTAYDAYLGVSAATAGATSFHELRYLKLESEEVETLPVELSSFTATQNTTTSAQIKWATQSETNVNGFSLYRATNELLAEAINITALIPATNTATLQVYQYTDRELYVAGTYYYWLESVDLWGGSEFFGPTTVDFHTAQYPATPEIPLKDGIQTVYPNPFNPSATISYALAKSSDLHFLIYNTRGQLVRSFSERNKAAGNWKTSWNGLDNSGQACASGVYQIIMQTNTGISNHKAVLLK